MEPKCVVGSGECQFLVEQARSSSSAAAGEGASSFKTQFTDMITLQLPVPLFRGLLETQGFSQGQDFINVSIDEGDGSFQAFGERWRFSVLLDQCCGIIYPRLKRQPQHALSATSGLHVRRDNFPQCENIVLFQFGSSRFSDTTSTPTTPNQV